MRWRILALVFCARLGLGLHFQTMGSVGEEVRAFFGLQYSQLGLLIGLFMAPGLILSLPAGYAGSFLSDRWFAVLGLILLAAGGVVSAAAPSGSVIGVGRLLSGTGFVLSTLYFTKMISDWFEGREIATAMSLLVLSWPIGIALGQVGHSWLADVYSWRVPFQLASAYCLAVAAAMALLYRPPAALNRTLSAGGFTLSASEWRLIVSAGAAWALFNGGYVVYLSFGPRMLEQMGYTTLSAAATISLGSWLTLISFVACGYIADRFGRRDAIIAGAMVTATAALALLILPGGGLAGSLLFGLIGFAPAGVIMALAGDAVSQAHRAFGMGIFFTIYYAVMMAVPPIAGALVDATGHPAAAICFAMMLFMAVLPAVAIFRRARSLCADPV